MFSAEILAMASAAASSSSSDGDGGGGGGVESDLSDGPVAKRLKFPRGTPAPPCAVACSFVFCLAVFLRRLVFARFRFWFQAWLQEPVCFILRHGAGQRIAITLGFGFAVLLGRLVLARLKICHQTWSRNPCVAKAGFAT